MYYLESDHCGKVYRDNGVYATRVKQGEDYARFATKEEAENVLFSLGSVFPAGRVKMDHWTIERVKRELPPVKVRLDKKKTVWARVSGRLNQFATVTVDNHGNPCGPFWADFQFSWEAITNALNSDKPLLL